MRQIAEFIAVLSCALFTGAAVYITFVEHPARMQCGVELAATQFAPSYRRATVSRNSLMRGSWRSWNLFDRAQLAFIVDVCRRSRSLSDAGRTLFGVSRTRKTFSNDADRLRKYLGSFHLEFSQIQDLTARL
jgi:sigma54-dependent transcription regulator